jgi:hypothetical protein
MLFLWHCTRHPGIAYLWNLPFYFIQIVVFFLGWARVSLLRHPLSIVYLVALLAYPHLPSVPHQSNTSIVIHVFTYRTLIFSLFCIIYETRKGICNSIGSIIHGDIKKLRNVHEYTTAQILSLFSFTSNTRCSNKASLPQIHAHTSFIPNFYFFLLSTRPIRFGCRNHVNQQWLRQVPFLRA